MNRLLTQSTAPYGMQEQLKRKISKRNAEYAKLAVVGYWLCLDCSAINSREEDDHGQPAYCSSCKSHKLKLMPPALRLLEPEDLRD